MVSTRSSSKPSASSLTKSSGNRPSTSRPGSWSHTPDRLTLAWLLLSLPLVIWDTGYVLGRPHTMPGGRFAKPLYTPYALYGQIDHVYGWQAWEEGNGFTAAQSAINVIETAGYLAYLWILWRHGEGEGFGRKTLRGGWGGLACLAGFALAVMTVSKTLMYGLIEYFSGFTNIGHNTPSDIFFLYILPNGAWIVVPSYLIYALGRDILHGLAIASGDSKSTPARASSPSTTKEE